MEGLHGDPSSHARSVVPTSELTLAGFLKHLALVEDSWFQEVFLGQPPAEPWASAPWDDDRDWEFHTALDDDPAYLVQLYRDAIARSRRTMAAAESLDELSVKSDKRHGAPYSLRWILLHMIEETARHCGHADLLREAIDGRTGD